MKELGIICIVLALLAGGMSLTVGSALASSHDWHLRWMPPMYLASISSVGLFIGGCILVAADRLSRRPLVIAPEDSDGERTSARFERKQSRARKAGIAGLVLGTLLGAAGLVAGWHNAIDRSIRESDAWAFALIIGSIPFFIGGAILTAGSPDRTQED